MRIEFDNEYLSIMKGTYDTTNNIALQLMCNDEEPYVTLTVNIVRLPKDHACIDTNNFPEAEELIEEYELGTYTGTTIPSGYCEYPVYKLNMYNINKYLMN